MTALSICEGFCRLGLVLVSVVTINQHYLRKIRSLPMAIIGFAWKQDPSHFQSSSTLPLNPVSLGKKVLADLCLRSLYDLI